MAQTTPIPQHSYKQGHSERTISTHLLRTAESEASFLILHLQPTHHILDVGCGPGTITTGFSKNVPQGSVTGIDVSTAVLEKARSLAASQSSIPTAGPGSVTFSEGNVLSRLPYPDASFDIVFSAHVFGHLPPPGEPLQALAEIRRVLKPGGLLATRDAVRQNFFPSGLGLDRLWVRNFQRVILGTAEEGVDTTPGMLPKLLGEAGFDSEGGKVRVGAAATVHSTREERTWLVERGARQLRKGDAFYENWLKAGITEEEIEEVKKAAKEWAETGGAWFVTTMCEMLAWK